MEPLAASLGVPDGLAQAHEGLALAAPQLRGLDTGEAEPRYDQSAFTKQSRGEDSARHSISDLNVNDSNLVRCSSSAPGERHHGADPGQGQRPGVIIKNRKEFSRLVY